MAKNRIALDNFKDLNELEESLQVNLGLHYKGNEAVRDMILSLPNQIDVEIQDVKDIPFSIMLDESVDLSMKKQLSVFVRYSKNGIPLEKFIHIQALDCQMLLNINVVIY